MIKINPPDATYDHIIPQSNSTMDILSFHNPLSHLWHNNQTHSHDRWSVTLLFNISYYFKSTQIPQVHVLPKTVIKISVKTLPIDRQYFVGDNVQLDPSGLVVHRMYDNGSEDDIAYDDHPEEFSFNYDFSPGGNRLCHTPDRAQSRQRFPHPFPDRRSDW